MASFSDALKMVLKSEGGFVNDPSDHGGATNEGVTQVNYDSYRRAKNLQGQSVKNISPEEVSDIYLHNYWIASKCDQLPIQLAFAVFDTAVNSGVGRAAKFLQKSVGATEDGMIGPNTLASVNDLCKKQGVLKVATDYIDIRESFLKAIVNNNPSQSKFLTGWLNRTEALKTIIMGLA